MKYKRYYLAYILQTSLIGKMALSVGFYLIVIFLNCEIVYADDYKSITEQEYDSLPIGESYGYYGYEHISDAYSAIGNMRVILSEDDSTVIPHQIDLPYEIPKVQELPPLPPITGYIVLGAVVLFGMFFIGITILR